MVNQVDSPDGKPRKDPDRPSPALVETDPAMQRMPQKRPVPQNEAEKGDVAADSGKPSNPLRND
ncbi:hypothetical protein AVKW3434_01405 [Acidovorax sp. SUPP3434]|uniref:hypothetical protein n=1 Tax=Acidovorax sp. SUPP3434 TaxID=2920880 RepID=UPI0023DE52DD|nr:hypothetical protein [Acidovorax sp. SUPP3434]GKS97991.1 hypothetical protein AVKW3434_01405 [Acidovorax sp. SUPP3434]